MSDLVTWPPKVGSRIHHNSGHRSTSWSGEVRAVLEEDEIFVVRKWLKHKGWHRYECLERFEIKIWKFRTGGLPKDLK